MQASFSGGSPNLMISAFAICLFMSIILRYLNLSIYKHKNMLFIPTYFDCLSEKFSGPFACM